MPRTFTVWESGDGDVGQVTLVMGTEKPWHDPDAVLTHTFEAASQNDASRRYHESMGWEPYKPMLREDRAPYPEDEEEFEDG